MLDVFLDSCLDVLKNIPILLAVYAALYWLEHKMRAAPALLEKAQSVGPVVGAVAGLIPQCGFSAAASALYVEGFLAPATLVAVFLATSDEAVPLMLSAGDGKRVLLLLAAKLVLAAGSGYLLQWTVFRQRSKRRDAPVRIDVGNVHDHHHCSCDGPSVLYAIVWRTVQTCLFLFVTVFLMNSAVHLVGEESLAGLLLGGSLLQPVVCAVIGLVPSCAISVLLAELYLSGAIGFGGLIAGLSTGAGFGYMILLKDRHTRKKALPVIAATWVMAAAGGVVCQLIWG